ncbi:MAG: hypothetical protein M3R21_10355 [Candidatus Dormibacteraeota bacterium]|nr:hypothetical protein [Candidatus Dormibacteraeota bacterium]
MGILFGLFVAAAVMLTAVSSSAAARPAPNARSQTAVWTNTSGVQQHARAAASKEMRALKQQAARPLRASNGGYGSGTYQLCSGTKVSDTPQNQDCLITASTGTCIQRSSAPVVVQRCTFTQTAATTDKRATALQIHNPEGSTGTQDGTQVITVSQSNTSRKNLLIATQIADQDQNASSVVGQKQEAHQSIDGTQTATGTGSNASGAIQDQHLEQLNANASPISQLQNTEDRPTGPNECNPARLAGFPTNECYTIVQNADTGANFSTLGQGYNLFQNAGNALAGTQAQGSLIDPFNGGLDDGFQQNNSGAAPAGTPIQLDAQVERLTQRRVSGGAILWSQHGPTRQGPSFQNGGSNTARSTELQDSALSSTPADAFGDQTDVLAIRCRSSSGICKATQRAQTNDDMKQQTFQSNPGQTLVMTIGCGSAITDMEGPGCVAAASSVFSD